MTGKSGVSLVVESVLVSGDFASWNNFSLYPKNAYEVAFDASVSGPFYLNLSVNYNASIEGGELASQAQIGIELSNVSLRFISVILANQSYYDLFSFADLESLPCLGQGILDASLLQLLGASMLRSVVVSGPANSSDLGQSFLDMVDQVNLLLENKKEKSQK